VKSTKGFLPIYVCFTLLALVNLNALAQSPRQCQPADTDVAVYNFVPEPQLQSGGEFRPLLKTETGFLNALRQSTEFEITDFTTPILDPELMPEPPRITESLEPAPAQTPVLYFFVGEIKKGKAGFLLTVQLKKADSGALLHEAQTPFNDAAGAEAAGTANATEMLTFLASQIQGTRGSRESGEHAIDPHIDLIIEKLQLKPEEVSKVKVVLTDCDGLRLKHRTIEAQLQLTRGGAVVDADTLERVTDEKGERNGDIGAHHPGVINYLVRFNYKDLLGVPREVTDARTIVISGGEADLWQMRADINEEDIHLYRHDDPVSHRLNGERYVLRKKASMVFVFKAPTDAEGSVFPNTPSSFNGFGQASLYRRANMYQDEVEFRFAEGLLDQKESADDLKPSFSIDPANNEFQAGLQHIVFRGTQQILSYARPSFTLKKQSIDWDEQTGASGSAPITPGMKRNGIYTFSKVERTPFTDQFTTGYTLKTFVFEVRRLSPARGMIKR
jgi:hypothetical protein